MTHARWLVKADLAGPPAGRRAEAGEATEGPRPHALVVEGEWTQPGGAQSAAQAYEYARHLKTPVDGEAPDGFDAFPFCEASIHAVVVANRCPRNA